jgi:hypothetical protein
LERGSRFVSLHESVWFWGEKIDFGRIDFIKLILIKINLKIKWFMFRFINVKVS